MKAKTLPRVLIADKIADEGIAILEKKCKVTVKTGQTEAELIEIAPKFDAILVRAASKITARIIKAGKNVKIIGRAGVGVDNIDVEAATKAGILVVNSPEGNIMSAAEHTIALMMSLARNVPQANSSMHEIKWEKSKFTGNQVFEKTLGVVGFGKIGRLVAERAIGLGMKVIVHDPYSTEASVARLGGKLVEKDVLLKESDYLTFHVPKSKETYHFCTTNDFKKMKKGVRIINCSRGGVIDEAALVEFLKNGKIAGAALDVFESEPLGESELLSFQNVIVTPHLGASRVEAQTNVAVDVAKQFNEFFDGVPPTSAVNMPSLKPEILKLHKPYFNAAEKLGILLEGLMDVSVESVELIYEGNVTGMQSSLITRHFIIGMLKKKHSDSVNIVNAVSLINSGGVKVVETSKQQSSNRYSDLITANLTTRKGIISASATLLNGKDTRIVKIDGFDIDLDPIENVLLISHRDKPGMIGKVGTILGDNDINIAGMQVGRKDVRGEAVMALTIDDEVNAVTLKEIKKIAGLKSIKLISFS